MARAIADVDGDRAGARDVMQERNRTEWSVLAGFLWWLHNPRMRRSATSPRSVVTLRSRRTGSTSTRRAPRHRIEAIATSRGDA